MTEYRTTDGGKLAPHPGMTDDDLAEFERWADEQGQGLTGWGPAILIGLILWGLLAIGWRFLR